MILTIWTDGGGGISSVNGPQAAAYVAQTHDGIYLGSKSTCLTGTNNDAEYVGVLLALKDLLAGEIYPVTEIERVYFMSDSMLIVNHINGNWRCKFPTLRVHLEKIQAIRKLLLFPTHFAHKKRDFNKNADRLCAAAMAYGPKTIFTDPIPSDPRKKRGKTDVRNTEPCNTRDTESIYDIARRVSDAARSVEPGEQRLSG
jgi:ribonuclease HI